MYLRHDFTLHVCVECFENGCELGIAAGMKIIRKIKPLLSEWSSF
jgi:hypothetical protein